MTGPMIDDLLAVSRSKLQRVQPLDALQALADGAVLIDIRADFQRELDGIVPGAVFVPRNVLEWRCAPDSAWRDPQLSDPKRRVILMCHEGYQSSLAAATLQELGLPAATDLVGGFRAWQAAGLPTESALTEKTRTASAYAPRALTPEGV
jgi:rhodanese-related sulfurtransferase